MIGNLTTNSVQPLNSSEHLETDFYIFFRLWFVFVIRDAVCIPPTVFGNTLILVSLVRFPRLLRRTTSGILVGSLAVPDLLIGLVVLPLDLIIRLNTSAVLGTTYCRVFMATLSTLVGCSVLNLFLLSVERFHAIMRPLRHTVVFTKRRVSIATIFTWIAALTFGVSALFVWRTDVGYVSVYCAIKSEKNDTFIKIISSIIVTSMTVNTIFFVTIAHVVIKKSMSTQLRGPSATGLQRSYSRRDLCHTRRMLIVSGLFIVFWAPFCVTSIIPHNSSQMKVVHAWLASLGLFNSSLNWIVYGYRSKVFRGAFKKILKCNGEPLS